MSEFTSGNIPGLQPAVESQEVQVTWSGRRGQDLVATRSVTIDAGTIDADNVPTSVLRGGVVLAVQDTGGKVNTYDPDANNGRQIATGVLERSQSMLVEGVATDRFTQMLVHGLVRDNQLVGLDPRAKQQLASRFVFDRDQAAAVGVLMHPRGVYRKGANYVVTAGDNGLLFLATAAVTFTLPTAQNGLAFRFLQTADADLIVATAFNNIVHKGNAAAAQVAFSTGSQKVGSQVLVECMYTGVDTLRWVVTNLGGTTATVS
jgi:hypothetical protein